MGRSDDSITRRRNKKNRKKMDDKLESSTKVSARVAAIIAAKNRRKSGKRRNCQGMCFSLPTPEDPFNENNGKEYRAKKRKRISEENKSTKKNFGRVVSDKIVALPDLPEKDLPESESTKNEASEFMRLFSLMGPEIAINLGKPTCQIINRQGHTHTKKYHGVENNTECPSKFFVTCLNEIQTALECSDVIDGHEDKPLLASAWGCEYWNFYSMGNDVLDNDVTDSTIEKIAWIASTAADTISMKEKEGHSFPGPFLIHLVPSREKASKVREVCKPLKALGIHTVSLHSGASLEHQIHGLKTCEPEVIVSTPERFLELLSLNAIDISGVSLLVIDGLESPFTDAYFDAVKSVRQVIPGTPQTVVFSRGLKFSSVFAVKKFGKSTSR